MSSSPSAAAPSPPAPTAVPAPQSLAVDASGRIIWRRVIAFLAMLAGMFMAILDIQIVAASLADIQAGLSAGADEITWVQTSYLIAEVIMIPLSGFLSRALGTRIFFTIAAAGFTLASLMCALATNITEMIIWRAVQGFIGGGMIPTVMATSYMLFPPAKQVYVNPIIGLIVTLAPTIGPTVGGLVTGATSWHWLFLINIVPGVLITFAVYTLVDFDKPDWSLLKRCDWIGLASMVGFLGPLEYVLEEGSRSQWFNDESIVICTLISICSAAIFFWRAFTSPEPIIDLRTFRYRNFGIGCTLGFSVGIGLFGLTYLFPVYLGQIRGYNALMIGQAVFVTGLTMFASAPLIGRLLLRFDPRAILATGLICFAIGTWQLSGITRDWDFWELFVPQILRGFGLMASMIPINMLCLGALPPERLKNAAGLYNVTRTLGGAVGLALLQTMLDKRTDLHLARLHERFTTAHQPAVEALDQLTQRFQSFGTDAPAMALKTLNSIIHRQGVVMAFADVFLVLTVMFLTLAPMAFLLRRPRTLPNTALPRDAH